jgi:hypothetical protein
VKIAITPLPGPEDRRLYAAEGGHGDQTGAQHADYGAFIRSATSGQSDGERAAEKFQAAGPVAKRIIGTATGVSYEEAGRMLTEAGNNVRTAIAHWEEVTCGGLAIRLPKLPDALRGDYQSAAGNQPAPIR